MLVHARSPLYKLKKHERLAASCFFDSERDAVICIFPQGKALPLSQRIFQIRCRLRATDCAGPLWATRCFAFLGPVFDPIALSVAATGEIIGAMTRCILEPKPLCGG
jgi:hypothetical protein